MDDETSQEERDQIIMAFIEENARFWADVDRRTEPWSESGELWDYGDPQHFDPQPVAATASRRPARCSYDRPRRAGRS